MTFTWINDREYKHALKENSVITIEDVKKFEEKIIDTFEKIMEKTHSDYSEGDRSLTDRVTEFIHDNYNSDISLNDISCHFNVTGGYITKIIKNKSGLAFKDYLNAYRIKKAKEFFKNDPDIKINDAAKKTGFNNPSSFIRMFKRYEGISPGEYMKNM